MNPNRIVIAIALMLSASVAGAQTAKPAWPERAVRRTIPLQPGIRRAYAAGTRDSSGSPGKNYWQQSVDYRISVAVDAPAGVLHGTEAVTLHNASPDTLTRIVLRLYQNYFKAETSRNDYVTDITDGTVIENLSVNGQPVSLTDPRRYQVNGTIATIILDSPIAPGANAAIDATWHFAVPRVDTLARGERGGGFGDYLYQIAQWYPQVAT